MLPRFLFSFMMCFYEALTFLDMGEDFCSCCLLRSMVLFVALADSARTRFVLCTQSASTKRDGVGELSHTSWISWSRGVTNFSYSEIPVVDHRTLVLLLMTLGATTFAKEASKAGASCRGMVAL